MRHGILAGGNWIVDHVKIVATWPAQDTLATIASESVGNGGSPYNILIDLARLGARFPLAAVGLVGDDENGRAIRDNCTAHGIDVTQLGSTRAAATSYTDVITAADSGRRTFFHHRGANAHLDTEHFDFAVSQAKLFHLGYLLLLDRLDAMDSGRPKAFEVLRQAREAGMVTSIDCVSENSGRFDSTIKPVLPQVDVLFANDFEAEKLTGISLQSAQGINAASVEKAARQLVGAGVQRWVIIHFPLAVYACDHRGNGIWQRSLSVPKADIAGAVGAGDALAAGILLGLHEEWPMSECLRLGICAAASSLYHATCSEGVRSSVECLALERRLGLGPSPT